MEVSTNTEQGKQGEDLAAKHLIEKGFIEKHRNWHAGKLEIDLIMQDGDTMVFVEVKLRRGPWAEDPDLAVNKGKINRLLQAAERWLEYYQWQGEIRFDIVSIRKPYHAYIIEHIADAFGPGPERFF
jgi:putative endonuclease